MRIITELIGLVFFACLTLFLIGDHLFYHAIFVLNCILSRFANHNTTMFVLKSINQILNVFAENPIQNNTY